MPGRGGVFRAVCVVLAVLCGACTGPGSGGGPGGPAQSGAHAGSTITVASFNFPESALLAHIYASALGAKGFRVRVMPGLGTREMVDPALMNGLVQLVPEYAGSALDFMSLGQVTGSARTVTTHRALARSAGQRSLVAAHPAPAQDNNAIVVTASTAARYHLRTIADLAPVARRLVFGGPPECPERPYCLEGLEHTYGLHFKDFAATDAGGPLTLQALLSGQINVGLLFTTDPSIAAHHLVVLTDNRDLQPAENVTPLVSGKTIGQHGPRLLAALNEVSARLSTATLRRLDARVSEGGLAPREVADRWVQTQARSRTTRESP